MQTLDQWRAQERAHADRVVAGVNQFRLERGWTVRDLAARLNDAGWPVELGTLNGILSGRKRGAFTVCEMLAFAEVFEIPVSDLPFPPLASGKNEKALRDKVRRQTLADIKAAIASMERS